MHSKSLKKYIRAIILMMITAVIHVAAGFEAYAQNTMAREHQPAKRLITQGKLYEQISYLCDTICSGRGAGERGGGIAGLWLKREFERIGLKKMGKSYALPVYLGHGKYGRNIVGMLPGSKDFKKDKYVVIGAHYDHLGAIDGKIYPGADANASGTVAMLSIAEMLSAYRNLGKSHDSNVIFVAFDAKEHNMAGSKALWNMIENGSLKDPVSGETITKGKITLMVNIDQIGSSLSPVSSDRKDYIIMLGTPSLDKDQRDYLASCNAETGLGMDIALDYYGSENFTEIFYRLSDQRVFVDNRKPAVLFTSGITMNNNKTWDRTENLDLEICHKRINLMYHWIEKML